MKQFEKRLWLWLFIMILLSPLGVILPEILGSGDAWGEWGIDTLEKILGYVPEGLKKTADTWRAPIRDYNFGGEDALLSIKIISYLISGIIGVILTCLAVIIIAKIVLKDER